MDSWGRLLAAYLLWAIREEVRSLRISSSETPNPDLSADPAVGPKLANETRNSFCRDGLKLADRSRRVQEPRRFGDKFEGLCALGTRFLR